MRQLNRRARLVADKRLADPDDTLRLERFEMATEVAVGQMALVAQFGEGETFPSRAERREDCQAAGLVEELFQRGGMMGQIRHD